MAAESERKRTNARRILPYCILVVLLIIGGVVIAVVVQSDGSDMRDPHLWPFASTSPWNTPLGSGARFAATDDARTRDLLDASRGAGLNAEMWSHPIYQASPSDPLTTVTDWQGTRRYRIPAAATPALPRGGDMAMHVVDPTRHWVDESWYTTPDGAGYESGLHVRNDLYGSGVDGGTRAAGVSAIGGLIRTWELEEREIRHALAFAMPRAQMMLGPVWPANQEDLGAEGSYQGTLPMGTLVAIPPGVDLDALDLSPSGRAIAEALQDYGAYLVDASENFALYAEPGAEAEAIEDARADLEAIRAGLRVVTNNSPTSVGGGGTRRAAPAPPLS